MAPRGFDRYMLVVRAGNNRKFATLTDPERCAHFLGVLSVAAQSPIRGYLLISEGVEAGPEAVAADARVPVKVARSAMDKLIKVGVLVRDEEVGAWFVHDWDEVNPAPKIDNTVADRQRRYRERNRPRRVSSAVKNEVMERDQGRCVACGSENQLEYHHRVRVVDGGNDDAENLEIRCRDCHRGDAGHARVTPESRPSHAVTHRNGHANVTPPEVKKLEVEVLDEQVHQARRKRAPTQTVDQNEPPAALPSELHPVARSVLGVLAAVQAERGGDEPTIRGVGLAMLRHGNRDFMAVARELEHWATAGRGARKPVKDWARTFATFLGNVPEGTAPKLRVVGSHLPEGQRATPEHQAQVAAFIAARAAEVDEDELAAFRAAMKGEPA